MVSVALTACSDAAPLEAYDPEWSVTRMEYDGWGNLQAGGTTSGYAFTGREWDPETSLYYYRARYYRPQIGRFMSEDPVRFLAGPNSFGYVANDPVNGTDPHGLQVRYNKPPPDTVPVPPDIELKILCLERCLGRKLIVTGGAEKQGHKKGSKHYSGQAVDFGFPSNRGLQDQSKQFFCCARQCDFKYGQTEGGRGPHFHVQTVPGTSGGSGEIGEPCTPAPCG